MFCRKCGKEISDEALFCPECGYQTSKGEKQIAEEKRKSDEKPIKGGVLGFVLAFFAGLIGFILCLCLGDKDCKKAAIITFIIELVLPTLATIVAGIIWLIRLLEII